MFCRFRKRTWSSIGPQSLGNMTWTYTSNQRDRTKSNEIVQLNEQVIRTGLKELIRQSADEVLNSLPDAEADRLTNAHKYERTEGRQDTRSGHYPPKLLTALGEVELKIPKLGTLTFETAIIQRYQGTSAEKPVFKKRWWSCIWQGYPPDGSKISPNYSGTPN